MFLCRQCHHIDLLLISILLYIIGLVLIRFSEGWIKKKDEHYHKSGLWFPLIWWQLLSLKKVFSPIRRLNLNFWDFSASIRWSEGCCQAFIDKHQLYLNLRSMVSFIWHLGSMMNSGYSFSHDFHLIYSYIKLPSAAQINLSRHEKCFHPFWCRQPAVIESTNVNLISGYYVTEKHLLYRSSSRYTCWIYRNRFSFSWVWIFFYSILLSLVHLSQASFCFVSLGSISFSGEE